ncbi:MAG: serine/threonine-protein kinase [Eubacteriales bacterium]|nr:serine/threonine-protein kinase [Eubacteriales bacterium]
MGTVIGYGGFGIIYRVWDDQMRQIVAVKEYFPGGLVNRTPGEREVVVYSGNNRDVFEAGLERYMLEARTMAAFSHPNIVRLFDYFEENNTAYIVMELLDGISLKKFLLQNGGKLSIEDMKSVILPVLDALGEMHSHNIIHRDVSPDNIFLCVGQTIKLIDFGAARFSDSQKEKQFSVVLKPGYAPPEQYRGKSRQGSFTDIYAVGACMYRILTGVMPEESLNRMMEDRLKEPGELLPDLPSNINNIILKAMALSVEYRFQTVFEMRDALEGKETVISYKAELKKRKARRKVMTVLGICGAAAVCVTTYFFIVYHTRLIRVREYTKEIYFYVPESQTEYYEAIEKDFETDNARGDISIVSVPESSYKSEVLRNVGGEKAAVLFFSDGFEEGELDMAESLKKPVIDKLENLESRFYYLDEYYKYEKNYTRLPLSFSVPIIVENKKAGKTMGVPVRTAGDFALKKKKKGKASLYKVKDTVAMQVQALAIDEHQISAGEEGLTAFLDNRLAYYVTDWQEYKQMITNVVKVDLDILYPAEGTKLEARLEDYVSISEEADMQAKMIAEDFVQYIINSQAAYLPKQSKDVFPINSQAMEVFSDIWILSLASSVNQEETGKAQFIHYLHRCSPME